MTKPQPTKPESVDVPADNPTGTIERFTEGLRRVLAAPKPASKLVKQKPKRR